MIFFSSVVALLVDYYIYKRVISRHNFGKLWRVGYIVYAVVVDTMLITALILYKTVVDWDGTVMLRIVMAVIGFFFLNATPKFVYAVISLGDYVVQCWRKRGVSHIFGYTGTAAALLAFGVLAYSMTIGRSQIRVERVELTMSDLPRSFDGLRIVHFSDNHIGTTINRDRFLARMVDSVNMLRPDIIVNSGDIVNAHAWELDEQVQRILGQMNATYGTYSALGNHDLGIYIKDTVKYPRERSLREVVRRQRNMGWTVLRNSSVYLSNGQDSIVVTGIDYPEDNTLNSHSAKIEGADVEGSYAGIPDSLFNLTISHAPQIWDDILSGGKADLTLAGHVHAMQIKFRLGRWLWSPAMLVYDRWSGLYEEDGRYLYINDGMGCVVFPTRVGVKPEITLYVLHSGK